jgi:ElaB/YqjD/DUF883 family membrane-anchored ribosome-binding protein
MSASVLGKNESAPESVVTQLTAAVDGKIGQASTNMHKAVDKLADAARPAAGQIASGTQTVLETLGDTADRLKDMQEKAVDSLRSSVKNKPLTTLGIALAAGFLMSLFLKQN